MELPVPQGLLVRRGRLVQPEVQAQKASMVLMVLTVQLARPVPRGLLVRRGRLVQQDLPVLQEV